MSQRNAELITESATARQRPVRNLSAYVKVMKDNKADDVLGVEHRSQTILAGGNHQRQASEPACSAASMEEPTPEHITVDSTMRQQSKFEVKLETEEGVHNVRSHDDRSAHKGSRTSYARKRFCESRSFGASP